MGNLCLNLIPRVVATGLGVDKTDGNQALQELLPGEGKLALSEGREHLEHDPLLILEFHLFASQEQSRQSRGSR